MKKEKCMYCKYRYETFSEWLERWYGKETREKTAGNRFRLNTILILVSIPLIGLFFLLMILTVYDDNKKIIKRQENE